MATKLGIFETIALTQSNKLKAAEICLKSEQQPNEKPLCTATYRAIQPRDGELSCCESFDDTRYSPTASSTISISSSVSP